MRGPINILFVLVLLGIFYSSGRAQSPGAQKGRYQIVNSSIDKVNSSILKNEIWDEKFRNMTLSLPPNCGNNKEYKMARLNAIGIYNLSKGKFKTAGGVFREALRTDSTRQSDFNEQVLSFNLAISLIYSKDSSNLKESLEIFKGLDADFFGKHGLNYYMGVCNLYLEKYALAENYFTTDHNITNSERSTYGLLFALYRQEKIEQSSKLLLKENVNTILPEYNLLLGNILFKANLNRESLFYYEKLMDSDKSSNFRTITYNKVKTGIESSRQGTKLPTRKLKYKTIGEILTSWNYTKLGDYEKAEGIIESKSIDDYKNDYRVLYNRAYYSLKSADYTKAKLTFEKLIKNQPNFANAYLGLGITLFRQGAEQRILNENPSLKSGTTKSIAYFTKAIQLDPKLKFAYEARGLAYILEKNISEGFKDLNFLTSAFPDYKLSYESRVALGFQSLYNMDFPQAQSAFKELIKEQPKRAPAYVGLGLYYKSTEESNENAFNAFDKAISLSPNDGIGYANRANCHYELAHSIKNWNQSASSIKMHSKKAKLDFEKAISLDKENLYARNGLAMLYQAQGELDSAESVILQTLDIHEKNADLSKKHFMDERISILLNISKIKIDNALNLLYLKDTLNAEKKMEESLFYVNTGFALKTEDSSKFYFNQASGWMQMKYKERADEIYNSNFKGLFGNYWSNNIGAYYDKSNTPLARENFNTALSLSEEISFKKLVESNIESLSKVKEYSRFIYFYKPVMDWRIGNIDLPNDLPLVFFEPDFRIVLENLPIDELNEFDCSKSRDKIKVPKEFKTTDPNDNVPVCPGVSRKVVRRSGG